MQTVDCFLDFDYTVSNRDTDTRYYMSNIVLKVYLVALCPKVQSRVGSFCIGSLLEDGCPIRRNGSILSLCTIVKCDAASAAQAELGTL